MMAGSTLLDVADDGVVGVAHDRRLGVGVDDDHRLGVTAAGDVLRGAADPAGDVEVRRHLGTGLPHLLGVRTPAVTGDDARATDRAAEQLGELLQRRETLGAADAAATRDDDLRVGQRDAGGLLSGGRWLGDHEQVGVRQLWSELGNLALTPIRQVRRRRCVAPELDERR